MEITTQDAEVELIAQAMLNTRGDLNKVSRNSEIGMNVMQLRELVRNQPKIRERYQELLTFELQDSGLHISERLLKFSKVQDMALTGDEEAGILPDPKLAIDISKHISELIRESRSINVSEKSVVMITSKGSVVDLLQGFLDS